LSHLITVDASALRARERMLKKYGKAISCMGPRFAKSTAVKDDAGAKPHFCVEGLGLEFEKLIVNKLGETILFEPNSFDKYFESGRRPEMWLRHNSSNVIGSNVELCLLDKGIAFRFPLPDTPSGKAVKDMVLSGEQTSISVGFTQLIARDEVHCGHTVTHIEEAEIREISVCPRGACATAFVRLIDAHKEPPLHASVNSTMFGIEHDLHYIGIIKEDIDTDIDSLKRRLSALQAAAEYDEPHLVARSMTPDQCNRLQTERYEAMISDRRTMLGM
jgi:HK97 family phage prohead protease